MNQILGKYKAYAFQRPIYGLWRGHFTGYLTAAPLENKKKVDSRARIGARAPSAVMATLRQNAGAIQ